MPQEMNNTGYIPSNRPKTSAAIPDADASVGLYVAPIDGLPIFMQGKRPTCVSHGVAWAKMQYDLKHTGSFKVLSRRFLHALSKESWMVAGDGRSIDKVLEVAETYGIPEESYFPEDDTLTQEEYEDASKIPPEAFQNALGRKIGSHGYITDLSSKGLYNAVVAHDILITGMDISNAWWTDTQGNITWEADKVLPLRPPHPSTSRHCVDIYSGNTSQGIEAFMNFWSINWGVEGTGFFNSDELPFIYEAAVILS